jgi:hypothetical protein
MKNKPFKKSYRKGEKIYRLICRTDNYGNLTVKIVSNTIKSVHNPSRYYGYIVCNIDLKFDNYGYGLFVGATDIAPRTKKGKEFLKKLAAKHINKKIKELSEKQNSYNILLSRFK